MKKSSRTRFIWINLLLVITIILPFIPGPPNKIVIGLSALSQLAGFFGLVLVPVGIIWTILEIRKRKSATGKFNWLPLYLIAIPLIAFVTRVFLVSPLSGYSRNFAIKRGESLIAKIESYKANTGAYPVSLQQLESASKTKIPSPFIMGIINFRYNKMNDRYSLSFSQWLECGSLEEIVLYDKHNLRNNLTGPYANYDYQFDLCRVKGAFASGKTKHDVWEYFLID